MKENVVLKAGNNEYTFVFDIRALANMERSIGHSILSIVSAGAVNTIRSLSIDVIAAGVKYGMKGADDEDPYDIIDEMCEAGATIDEIGGKILEALYKTGLFLKLPDEKPAAKKATTKSK